MESSLIFNTKFQDDIIRKIQHCAVSAAYRENELPNGNGTFFFKKTN